jgi:SWI/SNF-related matrix-associated actin-dependent regulator 1 of chromatin subfamily A
LNDLYPFQQAGAAWLTTKRFGLLADEMGLGKSAQAIDAAKQINAQKVCIVCPASVRVNWSREWAKFWPGSMPPVPVMDPASLPSHGSCVVSYDFLRRHGSSLKRPWDLLIADEIHLAKTMESGRTTALLGRDGLIHHAPRIWALSGTPAPNNVSEMFPLLKVAGIYQGNHDAFVNQFCTTRHTPYGRVVTGHKNIPAFRELIKGFILRRKKVDVMKDMPALRFAELYVPAGEVDMEMAFIDQWITGQMGKVDRQIQEQRDHLTAITDLVRTTTQAPATLEAVAPHLATLRRYMGLQKVPAIVDIVKTELESGMDKVVLFAIHKAVIEKLRDDLKAYGSLTLYGGTNAATRQANIDKFVNKPKHRVFVMNVLAAEGVDGLQKVCHNGILVEQDWVPGKNAQAVMRLHRIGQTLPVLIRTAILEGDDLDLRVSRVLARKTKDLIELFD